MSAPENIAHAAESLDDEIARLERELAEKKTQKARESLFSQLDELAGFFLCLSPIDDQPGPPNEHLTIAIEILRAAKVKYDHRVAVLAALPAGSTPRLLAASDPAQASGVAPGAVAFDGAAWRWTVRRPGAKSVQGEPFASKEGAEMDLARFLALNDGGAPFQPSKAFRDPGTGSIRRNGPGWQWKLQRDGEHMFSKSWPTREHAEAELAMVVADPEFIPAPRAVRANGKRSSGQGSIQPTGNGFQWRLSRDGSVTRSRTFATSEEASAELAQVIADPAYVPAPKDKERPLGTRPHRCSKCGETGHRAPGCPRRGSTSGAPEGADVHEQLTPARASVEHVISRSEVDLSAIPRFSIAEELDGNRPAAANRDRLLRERIAAPSEAAPDDLDEESVDEDDTPGWSPPDADGRQTCIPCNGDGVDNRPGPGAGNCCLHCEGEGYRWVEAPSPVPVAPTPSPMPKSPPPTSPDFIHPGRGWGQVDTDGYAKHELCGGTGKIRIKKTVRDCFPCEGAGRRLCVRRVGAEGERRTA